jgi:hypothetical protein
MQNKAIKEQIMRGKAFREIFMDSDYNDDSYFPYNMYKVVESILNTKS